MAPPITQPMRTNPASGVQGVYGPFETLDKSGPEGVTLLTLPFSAVRGCQAILSLTDNILPFALNYNYGFVGAEVSVWGRTHGMTTCLKRQFMRKITGPMSFIFDPDAPWEHIDIKARNMSGGVRSPVPFQAVYPPTNSCQLTISVRGAS